VHTYDPADCIRYVHMARETDAYPVPLDSGRRCTKLPTGYANGSPRTCLRHRRYPQAESSSTSALLSPDETAESPRKWSPAFTCRGRTR